LVCGFYFRKLNQTTILRYYLTQFFLSAETILTAKLEVRALKLKIKLFDKFYFIFIKKVLKVIFDYNKVKRFFFMVRLKDV
jgi:hypothetical protein